MHTRYNSQTPLTGGAKVPIFDKRLYRLKMLGEDISPCPPIADVARKLSFNNPRGALSSLKNSVEVKCQNQKLFYSLLFLYVLADEDSDQMILNSQPEVEINRLSLEHYDQMGRLPKHYRDDEYFLTPKCLHQAVRALNRLQQTKSTKEIKAFTAYYKSVAQIECFPQEAPEISRESYQRIRNEILKNSLRSAIQLCDKNYINFLAEFETPNLVVTPDICLALYHQNCFDALWVYSRCNMLAREGRYLSKRVLSKFHEIERNSKSARVAYDKVISEYPKSESNLHNYLQALLRSREHCVYLRRDYMENSKEVQGQNMASFSIQGPDPNTSTNRLLSLDTRNNLPRTFSGVGLKADQRGRTKRLQNMSSFMSEDVNEEEDEPCPEEKRRWNSSLFEVSMIGKFVHYLLSIDKVKECEPKAENSKIVSFLRHVKYHFGIEDESVLRILISMGFENEALYLIQAQQFRVSPEVYTTAIHCQAFILALLLEGGSTYIQQCDQVKKRKQVEGEDQDQVKTSDEYLSHPTQGYYLKLYSIYNEFNEVMLLKLKTRPQYLEILLFIWKRRLHYIDYQIALSILQEIEAQLDYAITHHESKGGYLRFVSNQLKIILLQIEFIEKLAKLHPQLLSKTTSLLKSLYDFSKRLQIMRGREEGMMEDSMRYILEDRDLEGRSVLRIITESPKLIDLVDHSTIEHKTIELWEGPYRVDRSLIPPNLRTVNSLLSSTRDSAVPLLFKCVCCSRQKRRTRLEEAHFPSKHGSQLSVNSRRASVQLDRSFEQDTGQQFKFGLFSPADETREFHKAEISFYQYESWREGQVLRYCQSYVFQFIIFLALHYFLLQAVSKNRSLGPLAALQSTTPQYLQSYLRNLQIFDYFIHSIITICLVFWGIPLHYIFEMIYKHLAQKRGEKMSKVGHAIDSMIFFIVFLGTVLIFPSFYSVSSSLQSLVPSEINTATLASYYQEVKKYKDEVDSPQLWVYLALVIALIWFQYVISLRVILSIGSLFKVLKMNSRDFLIWLFMFLITLAMFSIAGFNLSVYEITHTCRTFKLCLIMFFEASLGQISFAQQVNVKSAEVVLILCLIVNMVLLLTILVAMFNQSYNKIIEKAELYQMTDLYSIANDNQLNNNYGSFVALDYPLSVFPGGFILAILYCCNKRRAKNKNHKQKLQRQNEAINDHMVRFTSYALFWFGVSAIVLTLNTLLVPFIYICIITNECKLLCTSLKMKKQLSYEEKTQQGLNPVIIPYKARGFGKHGNKAKQFPRVKRLFQYSIWILLLGFPILLMQTLLQSVRFAYSLCKSQKSILKRRSGTIENFERYKMQFSFEIQPQSIATLGTLTYQEILGRSEIDLADFNPRIDTNLKLKDLQKQRRSKVDQEYKISITEARSSDEFSQRTLKESVGFKERLESFLDKQETNKDEQALKFLPFYKKVMREVKEKQASKKDLNQSFRAVPRRSKHSLSRNDNFFSNRKVSAQPREAQNIGKKELNEEEIMAHLLMHFSVKKEQTGSDSSDLIKNPSSLLRMNTQKEVPGLTDLELYLDCFVGIFSNLLMYSKLQRFTKNPYKIPPSSRANSEGLMAREEFLSSIVKISPGQDHPKEQKIVNFYQSFLKEDQAVKKLQPAVWIEEGALIKRSQIQTLFFVYNLEQLIQALHSFKSKGYREKDTLGELMKDSEDIMNISTKLIERSDEEKTFQSFEDSEIGKAFFSDTSRSMSLGRLSTERSFITTQPQKTERKSHFFRPEKTVEPDPQPKDDLLQQEDESREEVPPESETEQQAEAEQVEQGYRREESEVVRRELIISPKESMMSQVTRGYIETEDESAVIKKYAAEQDLKSEEELEVESEEEMVEDLHQKQSSGDSDEDSGQEAMKQPLIAWKTGDNWNCGK